MANRRPQNNPRRTDFGRNDRGKNFGRSGVSPWQGGGPGGALPNLLPLAGNSTEATLALASNIINLLQPRQNPVPSLLDMPIRRDFGPNMGRFDRGGFGPNRMGNQNFRRTGNYNRSGERINNNRKPFRPNDGQRQQNKSSPKKEADSKAKPVKESDQDDKKESKQDNDQDSKEGVKEEKKEAPKTRYDDINPALLKCHICNKSMWDGRSFENHLSGRAHAIMMQKTAESYALTADTMRQEFKILAQKNKARRNRLRALGQIREMKRTRKTGQQPARDFYCAMCDMYAADGALHRTTVGHRKLKKYLHPSCTSCHKEMPTRIELDEHRLSAEHLRNRQDKQEDITKPKPEVMVISTLSMEQSYLRDERHRRRRDDHEVKHEPKEDNQDNAEKKDTEGEGGEAKQEGEEKPEVIDAENTITDYNEGDDLAGVTKEQFPTYSVQRGVGRSFLAEFSCVQCRLCRKLLDGPDAADVHLRTWRHHQLFLRLLQEKTNPRTQVAAGEASEAQPQQDGQKRPLNSEESGDWKRRKTGDDAEQNGVEDDVKGRKLTIKQEPDNGKISKDAQIWQPVIKEEPRAEDAEGDTEMPSADDLEDWEQSVDEILNDEQNCEETQENAEEEKPQEEAPEEEETPAPEPVPAPVPAPVADKPSPSPRGRGRGRRRY